MCSRAFVLCAAVARACSTSGRRRRPASTSVCSRRFAARFGIPAAPAGTGRRRPQLLLRPGRPGVTGCERAASTRRATNSSVWISEPRNRSAPSARGASPRSAPPVRASAISRYWSACTLAQTVPSCRTPRPAVAALQRRQRPNEPFPRRPARCAPRSPPRPRRPAARELRDRYPLSGPRRQEYQQFALDNCPARALVLRLPSIWCHEQRVVRRPTRSSPSLSMAASASNPGARMSIVTSSGLRTT